MRGRPERPEDRQAMESAIMRIIDCHTHVPLDESQWPDFLGAMRRNGIMLAVVSGLGVRSWYQYPDLGEMRGANDMARRFCEYAGPVCKWLGYVNPQLPDALEELERCVSLGCKGVKLWVSLKDPETGSMDAACRVLERACQLGMPVKIHTFHRTGRNLPGEVDVREAAMLAQAFPGTRILAAHAGANWRLDNGVLCNARENLPNFYVDICGCLPVKGMVQELCKWLGSGHVLYGSDALGRSFSSQIAKVSCASIGDEDRERIFFRNAVEFFGFTEAELAAAEGRFKELEPSAPTPPVDSSEDHAFIADLPGDAVFRSETPAAALSKTRALGVRRTYASYGQSLFAWDLISNNREFMEKYGKIEGMVPLATLSPFCLNWREVLEQAVAVGFQGAALFPYAQNWNLADEAFAPFFQACAERRMPLWISLCIYDFRFHHPALACRPVAQEELKAFIDRAPANRYVFLGAAPGDAETILASGRDDFRADVSRLLDCTGWLAKMISKYGTERLVFGSEYPVREADANLFILRRHEETV